jgi:hypothetical protein
MNGGRYTRETVARSRATALTVAQALGDDLRDTVIIGGLVPAFRYTDATDDVLGAHVGTHDLDLALDLAILDDERYAAIEARLRDAGFVPDTKDDAEILVRQRWRFVDSPATVEFIMPPVGASAPGRVQSLTRELGAIRMIGIDLALSGREFIAIDGLDLRGYRVNRDVPLCEDGPFVVLKALALAGRDKAKDAYDLHFTLRHTPGGPTEIGRYLSHNRSHVAVAKAIDTLARDFETIEHRGPQLVCRFLGRAGDDDVAADVLAHVRELLQATRSTSSL